MEQNEFVKHPTIMNYEANRDGVIRHCIRERPISYVINSGYLMFTADGKKPYLCHRFVYECFRGVIEDGLVIDHIDSDPKNNSLDNLRAVTPSQNSVCGNSGKYVKIARSVKSVNIETDEEIAFPSMNASVLDTDLKIESPTNNQRFSFSRANSTGSTPGGCASSASSAHNTDDEDSEGSRTPLSYKDRRREAHTAAEQKRRDAIKKGYDELQNIVPTCLNPDQLGASKLSKATVLQKSIDYIQYLNQQKKKQEEDLDSLRKEVMALKIMKANYEHIVKTHQNTPVAGQNQVSDQAKFQVFQQIMDTLFQSFNATISVANFAELSACVFSWLEEYCKPQSLREVVLGILRLMNNQLNQ